MRHQKQNVKLGRSPSHRKALVSSLVCNLIKRRRITTTVQKAKLARIEAEKIVTLARKGSLHARRLAASRLRQPDAVAQLFADIVPLCEGRPGGYTRILKLGRRRSDGAEMAILEWAGVAVVAAPEQSTEE
ncbi:MAG: 50S ribosomal protein L17 [Kiritimatiellia bacterium]